MFLPLLRNLYGLFLTFFFWSSCIVINEDKDTPLYYYSLFEEGNYSCLIQNCNMCARALLMCFVRLQNSVQEVSSCLPYPSSMRPSYLVFGLFLTAISLPIINTWNIKTSLWGWRVSNSLFKNNLAFRMRNKFILRRKLWFGWCLYIELSSFI